MQHARDDELFVLLVDFAGLEDALDPILESLKLARQRLLGGTLPRGMQSAAMQQGLLQVVRDFCGHSNSICSGCRFPDLVKAWGRKTG